MFRLLTLAWLLLLLPSVVSATTVEADQSVAVTNAPSGNAYLAGSHVDVTAPLPGDLLALGAFISVLSQVAGDAFLVGGQVHLQGPVSGDVRLAGANVTITDDIDGELAVLGGSVVIHGKASEVRVLGGSVELTDGASGPVTVYAGSVKLSGDFSDGVHIVSADQVTLGENTHIAGAFEYSASQEAVIPASVVLEKGATYVGSSAYLPSAKEAETFAVAGLGIFFIVRIIAAMLVAGFLSGIVPPVTRRVTSEVFTPSLKHSIFLFLIGFGVMVGLPVLFLLLSISFVGLGLAFIVGASYVLLLLLGYAFSCVIAGHILRRLITKKTHVSWKDAVLGVGVLFVLGLIPFLGSFASLILYGIAIGGLCVTAYKYIRKHTAL